MTWLQAMSKQMKRALTQHGRHGQDEELQQRVLFLIGQPQEAHLGHLYSANTLNLGTRMNTVS